MRVGDTLLVWKSDRVSRSRGSSKDIINLLQREGDEYQEFAGEYRNRFVRRKLLFHLFDPLAEFEREMISDSDN